MGSASSDAFGQDVREYADLLRLPGLAVAVVQDGRIVHRQNEGYADLEKRTPIRDDSLFWIASLTKTFTAVLMMQYVREGKVSLDDFLVQYPFTSVGFLPQRIRPDIRLKHVLSHTSERVPGDAFVYHGGRFNFVYGVFQQVSGLSKVPEAYPAELRARLLGPLGLSSTLAGYPARADDPLKARIVMPYRFDSDRQAFRLHTDTYNFTTAFPATGILSCIDDLAAYTTALDRHVPVTRAEYETMTAPFVNNRGQALPYGLGWFTQRFAGLRLHWAYGYGDSDAALLVRVPDRKLSLIFLSNCPLPSEACRLGTGDILRSPFALAFLKRFVFPDRKAPIDLEELYTRALVHAFADRAFRRRDDTAARLTARLYARAPARFVRKDPVLIHLLSELGERCPSSVAPAFIRAYDRSRDFHPEILLSIGRYFDRCGMRGQAERYWHRLTDTPGYEEQAAKIEACALLGERYLERKEPGPAREYLWRALVYTRQTGGDDGKVTARLDAVNRLARKSGRG